MDLELAKDERVAKRLEHGPVQFRAKVNFSGRTISEPKPDRTTTNIASFNHIVIHSGSLQRRDALEWLVLTRMLPIFHQFLFVKRRPFKREPESATWKVTSHHT